jgi:selT/selW/selH-like putative selenoprotein
LADELKENLQVEAELFAEGKGIFDVVVDGKLIYSKYETGRFPDAGEVTEIVNSTA